MSLVDSDRNQMSVTSLAAVLQFYLRTIYFHRNRSILILGRFCLKVVSVSADIWDFEQCIHSGWISYANFSEDYLFLPSQSLSRFTGWKPQQRGLLHRLARQNGGSVSFLVQQLTLCFSPGFVSQMSMGYLRLWGGEEWKRLLSRELVSFSDPSHRQLHFLQVEFSPTLSSDWLFLWLSFMEGLDFKETTAMDVFV